MVEKKTTKKVKEDQNSAETKAEEDQNTNPKKDKKKMKNFFSRENFVMIGTGIVIGAAAVSASVAYFSSSE